ncbi:complement C1q-like protein 4 [Sander vitreus]
MRAILLLCLLQSAFGQYSWDSSASSTPPTSGVCLSDLTSCGCCLMQKQVERMESFFNISVNAMSKDLKKSKTALNNIRESRSAFSVALNNARQLSCFGPFTNKTVVIYKHVFINLGGGYSVETGIFTVPRSGVYSVALTVYSKAVSPFTTLAICAELQVNGQVVAGTRDINNEDLEDSGTFVVAIQLKAGDKVAVNLPIGCFLCDDSSHYNTFTGFLLYATD